MIQIKNVTKVYGSGDNTVIALDNFSMDIADGTFVAIIGKSGTGKSTLLNAIGALDKVSKGEIIVNGADITKLDHKMLAQYRNKNIGYIFQSFYLEPSYTVLQNVIMPLVIAGEDNKKSEAKAIEVLERLSLSEKLNSKVSTLSGGQKQRVSIARALVHNPSIVLADEPTGNLDSQNGAEVIKILKEISDGGKTVILVTHNAEDAKAVDIVIELQDGKIKNKTELQDEKISNF